MIIIESSNLCLICEAGGVLCTVLITINKVCFLVKKIFFKLHMVPNNMLLCKDIKHFPQKSKNGAHIGGGAALMQHSLRPPSLSYVSFL
jgi:hypothetical protein